MSKILFKNASQIVTPKGKEACFGEAMSQLTVIEHGCLAVDGGRIMYVGDEENLPQSYYSDSEVIDCQGKILLPGFVDSHTHLVFGGHRAEEYGWRMKGESYLSIMEKGGGIQKTIQATRNSSEDELFEKASKFLRQMISMGVTTVENKSGYGGLIEDEMKQLRVMRRLRNESNISVVNTLMAAHVMIDEYKERPSEYVKYIIEQIIPRVAKEHLVEFADAFLEKKAFTYEQCKQILTAAKAYGMEVKLHADEITNGQGAKLAAQLGCVSAEHLLCSDAEGLLAMKKAKSICVLLPITAFSLKEPYAKARWMIDHGCAVAIATDFNPGSSFSFSIPLLIALAVHQMNMSVEEAITAITLNGAAALHRAHRIGSLEVGKQADIVVLDAPHYAFLSYHLGINQVEKVFKKGVKIYEQN